MGPFAEKPAERTFRHIKKTRERIVNKAGKNKETDEMASAKERPTA